MQPGPYPEDLARAEIERLQADGLTNLLAAILPRHGFYRRKLAAAGLLDRPLSFPLDLPRLPFTTKAELVAAQQEHPPHGELLSVPFDWCTRMHQTSGTAGRPLRWYDTTDSWSGLLDVWQSLLRIVGVRHDDHLFFPFSFGPFLGFWSAFEAGVRYGCLCLPGGAMTSTARLCFLIDHAVSVVFCTPTYALHLLEVARRESIDLARSPVRALIVAGEPGGSVPGTRQRIETGWGARVFDHNGMTETGPLGIECPEAPGGLHLLESVCWPEVIDPASGRSVAPGTPGELVVTTFRRTASPLIRYRTGDLVCVDPRPCRCGRALLRLDGGIRGRVDDMVIVRGNNVHPAALQGILHRFPEVVEYTVEIDEAGSLTDLKILVEAVHGCEGKRLCERIEHAIRDELFFRALVVPAAPGTLPRPELKARRWLRKTTAGAADRPAGP